MKSLVPLGKRRDWIQSLSSNHGTKARMWPERFMFLWLQLKNPLQQRLIFSWNSSVLMWFQRHKTVLTSHIFRLKNLIHTQFSEHFIAVVTTQKRMSLILQYCNAFWCHSPRCQVNQWVHIKRKPTRTCNISRLLMSNTNSLFNWFVPNLCSVYSLSFTK